MLFQHSEENNKPTQDEFWTAAVVYGTKLYEEFANMGNSLKISIFWYF